MAETPLKIFTIPNVITSMAILSGSLAIIFAFDNPTKLIYASYFIALSAVFDFLDGFVARLIKQQSAIGKELDSLADLVSFGVAPAVIVYQMIRKSMHIKAFTFNLPWLDMLLLLSPILIIIFSALRLAKFNVDTRQSGSFMGLPTPASALLLASLPLIKDFDPADLIILHDILHVSLPFKMLIIIIGLEVFVMESVYFYLPFVLFTSVMMVAEMPLFSFKFKNYSWKSNRLRYVFLGISFVLLLFLQSFALPFLVLMYIFFSLLQIIKNSLQNKRAHEIVYQHHPEKFLD